MRLSARIKAKAARWFGRTDGDEALSDTGGRDSVGCERRVAEGAAALGEAQVVEALRGIFDPEIPVNIYDLGLIYRVDIDPVAGRVRIDMTLTAPGCPVAQTFPATVEAALRQVPGVREAEVTLVWDPPWTREHMSEAAKLQLGMF